VVEYLGQAGVVERNRCVEHCGVPGLQMVCDDACLGVPDLRRRACDRRPNTILRIKDKSALPPLSATLVEPLDDPQFVLTFNR
jgi:hypothetical protein